MVKARRTNETERSSVPTEPTPPQPLGRHRKTAIHECAFLKPHTPGLTAVATTPLSQGGLLAVARTDCSIILIKKLRQWTPIFEVHAPSGQLGCSVSSLQFSPCGRYLFVGRLDGKLIIFRVTSHGLLLHIEFTPGGGAIWDMAFMPVSPPARKSFHLAVACDDGAIRLVKPISDWSGEELPVQEYDYDVVVTSRAQGRALSVAWVKSEDVRTESEDIDDDGDTSIIDPDTPSSIVVCGDAEGGIRWLCGRSGRCLGQGRIPATIDGPVPIWTVQSVCNGGKVVCGDDRGLVSIWACDIKTMVAEVKLEAVKGAIWCSAVVQTHSKSTAGNSGLPDSQMSGSREVVVFGSANGSVSGIQFLDLRGDLWSHFRGVCLHTHDVRSIAQMETGEFVTASIDSRVFQAPVDLLLTQAENSDPNPSPAYLMNIVGRQSIQVIRQYGIILCRGSRDIEVWHIPHRTDKKPRLLLRMDLNQGGPDLRAMVMSENCQILAVSDADSFRLYRVWTNEEAAHSTPLESPNFGRVTPLEVPPRAEDALSGCLEMGMCGNVIVALSRKRNVVVLYNTTTEILMECDMKTYGMDAESVARVSCGDSIAAVCDSTGCVFIAKVNKDDDDMSKLKWHRQYFRTDAFTPCAFALSSAGDVLACSSASGHLTAMYSHFSPHKGQLILKNDLPDVITKISFSESGQTLVVSTVGRVSIVSLQSVSRTGRDPQQKESKRKLDDNDGDVRGVDNERKAKKVIVKRKSKVVPSISKRSALCEPNIFDLPLKSGRLLSCSFIMNAHIAVLRQNKEVLQSYLPDAIPKKAFGL